MTAPIDISALRHERQTRIGHHMLAHLRPDAYPVYQRAQYPPPPRTASALSYEENVRLIERAKEELQRGTEREHRPEPLTTK